MVYFIKDKGSEIPVKEAGTGDTVHSLLTLMEAVMEQSKPFNIAAKAIEDTHIFQYVE